MADIERDSMDVDVLFVGAGPANLAASYHLMNLLKGHNESVEKGTLKADAFKLDEMTIAIIEKGAEIGDHIFSGAVMDPRGISELMPDWKQKGCPVEAEVHDDAVMFLTRGGHFKLPITPPPLVNHGNYVVSLSKVCRWLGKQVEELGVQVFAGFPGSRVLYDESGSVSGVQTGDKGLDPDGVPKDNFEPGICLKAKVTVLGEGPRGNLTKQLVHDHHLDRDSNPMLYEVGVKEVFEVPAGRMRAGTVYHTMGYPLDTQTFGGGFIYGMGDNKVAVGMVVDLHSPDPYLDPHRALQELKLNPWVSSIIEGGKVIEYGGKTISIGGWYSQPRLYTDGAMIVGCSASMLNGARLKGIHTAIKSGMLAAETIYKALVAGDFSAKTLSAYKHAVDNSWLKEELYPVRNFHHSFDFGLIPGMVLGGIQFLMPFGGRPETEENHERTIDKLLFHNDGTEPWDLENRIKYNEQTMPNKLTDAYLSGTKHEEKQPSHLRLSDPNKCFVCWEKYRSPCTRFCPVKVYEMPENVQTVVDQNLRGHGGCGVSSDAGSHGELQRTHPNPVVIHTDGEPSGHDHGDGPRVPGQQFVGQLLHINFTNCIHCKTCDIKCPYLNLEWTPPEGGGGPGYKHC